MGRKNHGHWTERTQSLTIPRVKTTESAVQIERVAFCAVDHVPSFHADLVEKQLAILRDYPVPSTGIAGREGKHGTNLVWIKLFVETASPGDRTLAQNRDPNGRGWRLSSGACEAADWRHGGRALFEDALICLGVLANRYVKVPGPRLAVLISYVCALQDPANQRKKHRPWHGGNLHDDFSVLLKQTTSLKPATDEPTKGARIMKLREGLVT